MFSRISRYRSLPDVVVEDARGRTQASKVLRPLPEVTGMFEHTLKQGERLDHLAFTYYRQPRRWWRICDANPEFLSPLDLVGAGPVVTASFPWAGDPGAQPPWARAAAALTAAPGVESFRFVDDVRLSPEPRTVGGQEITVQVERHTFAIVATFNRLVVSPKKLATLLSASGFPSAEPQVIGRVGQPITIPPDAG